MSSILLDNNTRLISINESDRSNDRLQKNNKRVNNKSIHIKSDRSQRIKHNNNDQINSSRYSVIKIRNSKNNEQITYSMGPHSKKINSHQLHHISLNNKPVNLEERIQLLSSLLKNITQHDVNGDLNKYDSNHTLIQHSLSISPEQTLKNKQAEQDLINIKKFFLNSSTNTHQKNLSDAIFSNPELDNVTWKKMVKLNTAPDTWRFSHKLYNQFQSLKETSELDKKFLLDYPDSIVKIKGYVVDAPTKRDMLTQFKLAFPKLETRQLISTYANQELLAPAYMKMLTSTPEFFHYEPKNTNVLYELKPTKTGLLKLSVTHTAKLKFVNKNNEKKFISFGLRASILLTTNRNPNIKYSYYFK
ncbi:Putative uncharacterized protein Yba3 [Buchnera aphidicola (Eriosoma grossulariae)]|uniref:hypothetical protein n=1 Tax=Buchnera aphidicola TaxID=9 RepID=UPI003463C299